MQRFGIRHLGAMLSLVLVFGLLAAGIGVVRAQDTDVTVDGPGIPRPGHIHAGSCAELGDVVFALNNATVDNLDQDYESTGDVEFAGSEDANPVYVSETTIEDVTLDDILAADHAINFHLSGEDLPTYIACGDVGGFQRDGELYVGLVPVDEFEDTVAFAGSALLTDNGDDTVTVVVRLVELTNDDTGGTTATAATPIVTTPEESAAPSVEASVEESVEPSTEASVTPDVDESVEPVESETPAESEEPTESEEPVVSEEPVESAAPDASESPAA